MIPSFIIVSGALWPILPPGVHDATMDEVYRRYAINEKRRQLFDGFNRAADNIFGAGSPQIYLDGSYVTAKPEPGDYDALWDRRFVDPFMLDPLFLQLVHGTGGQKAKYLGEFFPSAAVEAKSGKPFMEFFRTDRLTGAGKGIIRIINYLNKGGSL
jgi:hypothetical protein